MTLVPFLALLISVDGARRGLGHSLHYQQSKSCIPLTACRVIFFPGTEIACLSTVLPLLSGANTEFMVLTGKMTLEDCAVT